MGRVWGGVQWYRKGTRRGYGVRIRGEGTGEGTG